jgi:hypothetical protein
MQKRRPRKSSNISLPGIELDFATKLALSRPCSLRPRALPTVGTPLQQQRSRGSIILDADSLHIVPSPARLVARLS